MRRAGLCAAALVVAVALTAGAAPAAAQVELSGVWQPRYHEDFPERIPGPELRDYLGLPINDAARQFAESWDPSRITLPEEQCRVHVAPYILRGPTNLRVWVEKDPKTQDVIAIKMYSSTYEQTRTIWMDGRLHPGPNAPHTWMGFSTGRWDGDMLIVDTTHLKQGWIRRNGIPMSDQAAYTEYIVLNGDMLSHISVVVDPVFLAEPLVERRLIAFRNAVAAQPALLQVRRPYREHVAFPRAGREAHERMRRERRGMRASVHPDRPRLLVGADVVLDRNDALRFRILLFPDPQRERPVVDVGRHVHAALMLLQRQA